MNRERLSDDVYVFTSERYAQVTAGLVVSGAHGILIDTLPFPDETLQMALFARKVCPDGVRLVIFTQHQADHTYGAFLFPRAEIIAHEECRAILIERGFAALDHAKQQSPELAPVRLRLPTLTLAGGNVTLRMPGKTLELFATPGHTRDSISVLLHEEKILFAGDTFMAVPTLGEGEPEQLKASIEKIGAMQLDAIVQGHGEIILRGEIKENVRRSVAYIDTMTSKVREIVGRGGARDEARAITLESCGLPRVLLNGVVTQLHVANALALYDRYSAEMGVKPRAGNDNAAPATNTAATPKPVERSKKVAPTVKADLAASATATAKPNAKAAARPVAKKARPSSASARPAKPQKPASQPAPPRDAKRKPAPRPSAKPSRPVAKKPARKPTPRKKAAKK